MNKNKKHSTDTIGRNRKLVIAGIITSTALIGTLAGVGGYYAYKSLNPTVQDNGKLVIDPTLEGSASLSNVKTLANGSKTCDVTSTNRMKNIKISIGGNLLTFNTDYTYTKINDNKYSLTVYKPGYSKYQGAIIVTPLFASDDETITESISIKSDTVTINITDLAEDTKVAFIVSIAPTYQKYKILLSNVSDAAKNYISVDSSYIYIKKGCPNASISYQAVANDLAMSNTLCLNIVNHKDTSDVDKFNYTLDATNKTFNCSLKSSYKASTTSLIIPSTYTKDGVTYTIKSISDFENSYYLKNIFIPKEVETIASYCFNSCIALENVTFETGSVLKEIDYAGFYYCQKLKSIELPSTLQYIGITEESYNSSSSQIFYTYNWDTFSGCSSLTKINIPANVKAIHIGCFRSCYALNEITVDKNNQNYTSRDKDGKECNGIFGLSPNIDGATSYGLISGCMSTTIPNEISLNNTTQKVTCINCYAFYDCYGLVEISIPDNVIQVGEAAFSNCESLQKISIGKSCKRLTYSSYDSTSYFSRYVLVNCPSLKEIHVSEANTRFCVDNNNFLYFASDSSKDLTNSDCVLALAYIPADSPLKEITIPVSIKNSTTGYTYPITSVYDSASMFNNPNLESVTFAQGSKITSISEYAWDNSKLKKILGYPAGISSFNVRFYTTDLTEFTLQDKASEWSSNCSAPTISGSQTSDQLVAALKQAYANWGINARYDKQAAVDGNNKFIVDGADTVQLKQYDCENNASVTIPSQVTLSGSKYTVTSIWDPGKWNSTTNFYNYSNLTSLTIPSTIEKLGCYSFYYVGSSSGMTFNFGSGTSSLKTIMDKAFYNSKITSITLPATVSSIGENAFNSCRMLTSADLSACKSLTTIPAYCFNYCDKLSTLKLPDSITTINSYSFAYCNLSEIDFTKNGLQNITYIPAYCFNNNYKVTKLVISDKITDMSSCILATTQSYCDTDYLRTIIIDSKEIAAKANDNNSTYLLKCKPTGGVQSLYIKKGLTVGAFYTDAGFVKQTTSDKDGYDLYTRAGV